MSTCATIYYVNTVISSPNTVEFILVADDIPKMDVAKRFAQNLVEQRKRKGLDPKELATRASVSLPHLNSMENGSEQPEMETSIKLAASLGVSIAALVDGLIWDPTDGFRVDDQR